MRTKHAEQFVAALEQMGLISPKFRGKKVNEEASEEIAGEAPGHRRKDIGEGRPNGPKIKIVPTALLGLFSDSDCPARQGPLHVH